MPGFGVRVNVPQGKVRRALLGSGGLVTRHVTSVGRQVENQAKRYAPVDTGRLRSSIQSVVRVSGNEARATIGTNVAYAAAIHEGAVRRIGGFVIRTKGRPFIGQAIKDVTGVTPNRGGRRA